MKLFYIQHPYWVLLMSVLIYAEEESVVINSNNSNSNSNVPNSIKVPFTGSYHENLLSKSSTTSTTVEPPDDIASTIIKPSSPGVSASDYGADLAREARIMVTLNRPNRTSDTSDFARNTVPVKDQTPTDPTVKKTESPWKPIRKPSHDFKNKLRGDRTKLGGPPGPDASMLAYNAFTPQLTEPTTERHVRKPFTTKSRPPPLSYLTSTAEASLPPTAWALTTLKGSAPVEHVRNTIPAVASDPLKGLRPRTTLSSVKPINSFWSTRLSSKNPSSSSSYAVIETTEPIQTEPKAPPETTSTLTPEKLHNSEDTEGNKINEDKFLTVSELTGPDNITSFDNSTVEEEIIGKNINSTQLLNLNKEVLASADKELNQTNIVIEEIPLSPKLSKQNNTVKNKQLEDINEAIKTDEKNQLSKIITNKYVIKPETLEEINNLMSKNVEDDSNNVHRFIENTTTNHTTENYGNSLTEKPFIELPNKEVLINKQPVKVEQHAEEEEEEEVSEKPNVIRPTTALVTELNKIISDDIGHEEIEPENNYNTAVYPLRNIINETKFTHQVIEDTKSILKDFQSAVNLTEETYDNEDELNTVFSPQPSVSLLVNNDTRIVTNESDQSTTSMTRATNATQSPINSTTEPNLITLITSKTNIEPNITETMPVEFITTTTSGSTVQEELTTNTYTIQYATIRNDISELSSSALILNNTNTNVTTTTTPMTTTQNLLTTLTPTENVTTPQTINNVTSLNVIIDINNTKDTVNSIDTNKTNTNQENNLNKLKNLNSTSKENDIKSVASIEIAKNSTKFSTIPSETSPSTILTTKKGISNLSTTESNTQQPVLTTLKSKWNNSVHTVNEKHYELNLTNNDIKLGGDLDLPVPTIVSVTSSPTTKSNYIKTTTEKSIITTSSTTTAEIKSHSKTEIPEMATDSPPITDSNYIKEKKLIKILTGNTVKNLTNNYPEIINITSSNINENETTTINPIIFRETDDVNEEDGLVYNTTGGDKKFAIDTVTNMTDHEIDSDGDEVVSGEKEIVELIPQVVVNSTVLPEDITVPPDEILQSIMTTEIPTITTPSSTIRTTIMATTTTPGIEEDNVTPIEDDNTGMEIEDYDTGVIVPMNVLLQVHATYKDMCTAKELLIESIVRFFKSITDRLIERKQIKILNLIRECIPPYPADKGVVPVHLLITDSQGQYDKRLTDLFVLSLVRQEPFSFKYPITKVEKFVADDMNMGSESQASGGTMIAAIVISSIAGLCLLCLTILLVIMRKRQRGFNYGQRCTPVSLDDYSLDNISVYNSVRRKAMRASKRSYGNPAFDDPTAISNSLNFAGLVSAVSDISKLEEEYLKIPVVTVKPDELPLGAEVKNRYANVIPLPETRVTLNTPHSNDIDQFINANFVKGAKGVEKFYIACQAPMTDTIADFWQMIWEQQSRIILMLTDLHENGAEKCADYLPPSEVLDCHRVFGDLQVTLKKREAREKYIISSLQLKNLDSNLWREVTHMWYVGWPSRGVPDDHSSIIAFLIEARSYAKNGPPVVVHCSPGTGRTGTIIAVDIAIRDFETDRVVDIPRTVYNVRRDRAGAVQTSQQYTFIYQVLHLYATKLTGGGLDSI